MSDKEEMNKINKHVIEKKKPTSDSKSTNDFLSNWQCIFPDI